MGFNSVFKALQEVFPQVDVRVLKAVAIEHSKDADAAVEFVVSEVLPVPSFFPQQGASSSTLLESPCSPIDIQDVKQSTVEENETEPNFLPKHHWADEEMNAVSPSRSLSVESKDANEIDHTGAPYADGAGLDEPIGTCSVSRIHGEKDLEQLCASIEAEEWKSLLISQEIDASIGSHQGAHASSSSLIDEVAVISGCTNDVPRANTQDLNLSYHSYSSVYSDNLQDESCLDSLDNSVLETERMTTTSLPDASALHQAILDSAECASKNDLDSSVSEFEKPGSSCSLDDGSEQVVYDSGMIGGKDDSCSATIVTRSGQICRIDLLEDAIRDAKSNKQILFLAMETVIDMMKDVELREKAAEQAKEEAARGGLDVLAKVEDLRQMLQHAKEANDMHSGEVYGEKAILATEVRELQARLISLSDERDNSLAILDEITQTLVARLAAAEEMRKAAEKEKDEKEDSARRELAEQEVIMDKVVQESKRLQLEAEENSKLREFLMDRGHVVDTLQGEIAVICQDVKLLKEKYDECVPISKSLYSSQTSCVLAASASSLKCIVSDWVPEEGELSVKSIASDWVPEAGESSDTPKRLSPSSSVHAQPHNSTFVDKGIIRDDRKELLDDEWDMFDA